MQRVDLLRLLHRRTGVRGIRAFARHLGAKDGISGSRVSPSLLHVLGEVLFHLLRVSQVGPCHPCSTMIAYCRRGEAGLYDGAQFPRRPKL